MSIYSFVISTSKVGQEPGHLAMPLKCGIFDVSEINKWWKNSQPGKPEPDNLHDLSLKRFS